MGAVGTQKVRIAAAVNKQNNTFLPLILMMFSSN